MKVPKLEISFAEQYNSLFFFNPIFYINCDNFLACVDESDPEEEDHHEERQMKGFKKRLISSNELDRSTKTKDVSLGRTVSTPLPYTIPEKVRKYYMYVVSVSVRKQFNLKI